MARHKLFVGNGVYPNFRSTPAKYRNFGTRAPRIAELVKKSGADCATFGEMGRAQCAQLANYLPWQYDRSQGSSAGEGLNSDWSNPDVWDQPEPGPGYNLPSGGQMQRTAMAARITEKKAPAGTEPGFVTLVAYHETLGNDAGMAYIMALIARLGERRVLLGGDFKRTDDDDDIAVMKKAGYKFWERVDATPMTAITQGKVTVHDVVHLNDSRVFDHSYLVVDFTIPNPAKDQA